MNGLMALPNLFALFLLSGRSGRRSGPWEGPFPIPREVCIIF